VNDALARVRDVFLEPAGVRAQGGKAAPADLPESVAVLGPPRAAAACAALFVLRTARSTAARCALVATWGGPAGADRHLPSLLAVSRVAAALRARALPATAAGRLVRMELAAEADEAADALRRAAAVVRGPVGLAISRPRSAGVDQVLAEQQALVVVRPRGADPAIADLAAAGLALLGPPVSACLPPARMVGALALAGLTPPRAVLGALSEAAT
jgi:hypothetical protein